MKINPVLVMTLLFSGLYGTRLPAEDTGPPVEPAATPAEAAMPDIAGVWKDLTNQRFLVWRRMGNDANPYQICKNLMSQSKPTLLNWNREYKLFDLGAPTPVESFVINEKIVKESQRVVWKYIPDRRVIYVIHFSFQDDEGLRTKMLQISKPDFDENIENLPIEDFLCFEYTYEGPFDRLESTDLVMSETADGLSGFSKSRGRWTRIAVPLPKDGSPRILNCQVGKNLAAVVIDNQALCYSSETGKWGRMNIPEDFLGKVIPTIGADLASMQIGDTYFTFSPQTGEWTSPEGTPANESPMRRGSANPTDSVRSATGHKDPNHPTSSNKYLNVLLFHVPYSSPCAEMVAAATTLRNQGYYIRLINIDEHAELARRFEVMKLPTTILMKEGNESEEEALRIVGLMSKEKFREFVVKYLKPEPSLVPQEALQLTSRIHQHEFEAHKLAQQLRLKSMNFGSEHPDILALREQLEGELAAALELRFQREELQVTDLQKRLKAVTEQIQRRKAVKQKILDRRLQELIDDDGTRWDREASGETPEATGEVGELDQSASQSETERPPLTSRIRITGP